MTEREALAALAAFLPDFEAPGFRWGAWAEAEVLVNPDGTRTMTMPPYDLHPRAQAFLDACHAGGWVRPFDWPSWIGTPEAIALRDDPKALAAATPEQLSRLLTAVIRQERFCEGALEAAFTSGLLTGIARRARALAG